MKGIFFSEGLEMNSDITSLGIEKKVAAQVSSLAHIGDINHINIELKTDDISDKIRFVLPMIGSTRERNREILLDSVDESIDYIYIRKPSLTIKFYELLKKIKHINKHIVILMEIPTYPFHLEYQGISKLMILKSIACEKKLKEVIDYIITYSDDESIWGIPCLRTSNCVDYASLPARTENFHILKNTLRMTCVANYTYWHGIDRLIKGINNYNGPYKIVFNVVGVGKELDNLKKLANGNSGIIFHGSKSGKELASIFDNTDIAVDALGRHRSGVYYNSSLKGKEYVARGIPVISAVKTELDYMKDFEYYLKLPSDDTDIDINTVIDFYNKIYSSNNGINVTKEIRSITEKKFDYKYGFENPIKELVIQNRSK